jgi:hypothetical protein
MCLIPHFNVQFTPSFFFFQKKKKILARGLKQKRKSLCMRATPPLGGGLGYA